MISAGVVADANVLLSATLGKAALRVLIEHKIPVHTTRFNVDEVMEYLPRLSSKYGVPLEILQLQWTLLPLQIHEVQSYRGQLEEARTGRSRAKTLREVRPLPGAARHRGKLQPASGH